MKLYWRLKVNDKWTWKAADVRETGGVLYVRRLHGGWAEAASHENQERI